MTDISRAIYSGEWKVYPFDGKAVKSGEAVEVVRKALEE